MSEREEGAETVRFEDGTKFLPPVEDVRELPVPESVGPGALCFVHAAGRVYVCDGTRWVDEAAVNNEAP